MKRRLISLLCALLLLSACAEQAPEPAGTLRVPVYFATGAPDGPAVASEDRRIPQAADPVDALLTALLSGPMSETLASPFPSGVSLRSAELDGEGLLTVDLSERYGGLSGVDLTIADSCIALTLCQLPQVEAVTVTVEGDLIPYRNRQVLRAGDVLCGDGLHAPYTLTAQLYYAGRDGGLSAESREVAVEENGTPVTAVLTALLAGPETPGLSLPLPESAKLLSARVEEGVCTVNFSAPFLENAPPDEAARLLLSAITHTLCSLDGVEAVRFLAEGQPVEAYGGVSMAAPLSPGEL